MNTAMQLMPLILLIFIMYFLLIRPQKKREKETAQMRNSLQVGDEIITIGGLCGKIVKLKDESLIIQVGADKIKFEVMRWSISKVVSSDQASIHFQHCHFFQLHFLGRNDSAKGYQDYKNCKKNFFHFLISSIISLT